MATTYVDQFEKEGNEIMEVNAIPSVELYAIPSVEEEPKKLKTVEKRKPKKQANEVSKKARATYVENQSTPKVCVGSDVYVWKHYFMEKPYVNIRCITEPEEYPRGRGITFSKSLLNNVLKELRNEMKRKE